jgi:hypothetical protein
MNRMRMLAIAVVAFSGVSLIGQQPAGTGQESAPTTPSAQEGAQANSSPTAAATPVEMRPVNGELVGKLDSKSAKAGDSVVVKTTQAVKTAEGTEIPKGSKLMGEVTTVKPHSQGNENGELTVRFDHAELKGGQSVPIQSVIRSVAPSESDAANNPANSAPAIMGTPMGGGAPGAPMGGGTGSMAGTRPSAPVGTGTANQSVNGMGAGQGSATGNNGAAGQVVGKIGDQPIRTTAIPGVLLASNAPSGASKFSGVFLSAKSDVHLSGGTQVVLEIAAAGGQ